MGRSGGGEGIWDPLSGGGVPSPLIVSGEKSEGAGVDPFYHPRSLVPFPPKSNPPPRRYTGQVFSLRGCRVSLSRGKDPNLDHVHN